MLALIAGALLGSLPIVFAGFPPHTGNDAPVSSISLAIPAKPPAYPTGLPINSAYISFSIEADRWPEWVGAETPNTYFLTLVNNLYNITGKAPDFRLGADTMNRLNAWYDPNVKFIQANFGPYDPITPYPKALNITIGSGYYDLFARLPPSTRVAITVNIFNQTSGYQNAVAFTKAFASPAMKARNVTLKWLEMGNEPDLIGKNMSTYVTLWNQLAMNISALTGMDKPDGPKIWASGLAHSTGTKQGFSVATILGNTSNLPAYKYVQKVCGHQYNGLYCHQGSDTLQRLMYKPYIRSNLTILVPDITTSNNNKFVYTLGETNTYCGQGGRISTMAGVALWFVEHALWGATLNIQQMYMQHGIGFKYNLMQPVSLERSLQDASTLPQPSAPYVLPAYYGAIIVAEAIGHTGTAIITEIPTGDANRISGYAFYENSVLKRAVFINSLLHNSTETPSSQRQKTHINLSLSGASTNPFAQVRLKRLAIRDAYDFRGLIWGGQTYDTSSGLVSGTLQTTTISLGSGFDIFATEVVMATFL